MKIINHQTLISEIIIDKFSNMRIFVLYSRVLSMFYRRNYAHSICKLLFCATKLLEIDARQKWLEDGVLPAKKYKFGNNPVTTQECTNGNRDTRPCTWFTQACTWAGS